MCVKCLPPVTDEGHFHKIGPKEGLILGAHQKKGQVEDSVQLPIRLFPVLSIPIWVTGSLLVLMQLINEVLHEHLYKEVLVYMNDILIYTETMEEHVRLVRVVLEKLQAAQLYAKLSKCEFHKTKLDYVGYHIYHKRVEMEPEKV